MNTQSASTELGSHPSPIPTGKLELLDNISIGKKLMKYVHSLSEQAAKTTKCVEKLLSGKTTTGGQQLTLKEVAQHCDSSSCWLVLSDKVYDVTEFLITHPGGEEIILENAGSDATIPFESKGHSRDAYVMMEQYCIGELVESDRRFKATQDHG